MENKYYIIFYSIQFYSILFYSIIIVQKKSWLFLKNPSYFQEYGTRRHCIQGKSLFFELTRKKVDSIGTRKYKDFSPDYFEYRLVLAEPPIIVLVHF